MPRVLPIEYKSAHKLAFTAHDLMLEHLVEGEQAELPFFKFAHRSEENLNAMKGLAGSELWDWFEANGYQHVNEEFSYRSVVFGLLSDFCHFMYEALRCSEKGKLSVAYALLRKPLQENLFYLEWLLADRKDFLARFRQGPEHIDRTKLDKDVERRKAAVIDIIGKAMDKTWFGRCFAPEMLYHYRYEKAAPEGFDRLFNRAHHLITTFKHSATEQENFNFIFTCDETREGLWRQLYLIIPVILFHALGVVRGLYSDIDPQFDPIGHHRVLWLAVGLMLHTEEYCTDEEATGIASDCFREMFAEVTLGCSECSTQLTFQKKNMRRFWKRGVLKCSACKHRTPLLDILAEAWSHQESDTTTDGTVEEKK